MKNKKLIKKLSSLLENADVLLLDDFNDSHEIEDVQFHDNTILLMEDGALI